MSPANKNCIRVYTEVKMVGRTTIAGGLKAPAELRRASGRIALAVMRREDHNEWWKELSSR
jgi:hypothetical protein